MRVQLAAAELLAISRVHPSSPRGIIGEELLIEPLSSVSGTLSGQGNRAAVLRLWRRYRSNERVRSFDDTSCGCSFLTLRSLERETTSVLVEFVFRDSRRGMTIENFCIDVVFENVPRGTSFVRISLS